MDECMDKKRWSREMDGQVKLLPVDNMILDE